LRLTVFVTTRILLVRHGQADPQGRFLQRACRGLTDEGFLQADDLARRLAESGEWVVNVILASRAKRAIDTATRIAMRLRLDSPDTSCALCEMHPGAAEGLPAAEAWPAHRHRPKQGALR
jgi:broad specificity phosphatase PhoE